MMTKVEAIVQPSRFEAVKEVLTELGIGGMTISDVRGHGRQKGQRKFIEGANTRWICFRRSRSKWLFPIIWWMPRSTRFSRAHRRERSATEKFFVSKVDQAIRIRNQERGVSAL